MSKLWRVPGVNLELHTAEICDKPGAYLVAVLPETERALTIRALKRIAGVRDAVSEPLSAEQAAIVVAEMPPAERFVPAPVSTTLLLPPPTEEEVARIRTHFLGVVTRDWQGLLRDMLTMFVDMRNAA